MVDTPQIGFYFAIGGDLLYKVPDIYYWEKSGEADIVIDINDLVPRSVWSLSTPTTLGDVDFVQSGLPKSESLVHQPRRKRMLRGVVPYNGTEILPNSRLAQEHRKIFERIFGRHPIGEHLMAIYNGAVHPLDRPASTLAYVSTRIGPRQLEQLARITKTDGHIGLWATEREKLHLLGGFRKNLTLFERLS